MATLQSLDLMQPCYLKGVSCIAQLKMRWLPEFQYLPWIYFLHKAIVLSIMSDSFLHCSTEMFFPSFLFNLDILAINF